MAEVLLTLEEVYALPEPSIQTYLQAKGWLSQNFLTDRISTIIFLAIDDWLRPADQTLVQLKDFPTTAGLTDEDLIARVQEAGQEVTVLMTRFDLVRKLLIFEIKTGYLYSFGSNDKGQSGLGAIIISNEPRSVNVPDGLKVKAVSCGYSHTAIITEDGNLYSFGSNDYGQLGLGDNTNRDRPILVTVPDGLKVKVVSCGGNYTMIITEDGNLYSFGYNTFGQLGLGDNTEKDRPILVTVPDGLKVKDVSCGGNHTVIMMEDGNLYSFGGNNWGQLGLGDNINRDIPTLVTVPDALKVKAVSCGGSYTAIITNVGNLYTFGRNEYGRLGLGDFTDKNIPTLVTVPDGLKVKTVSCGSMHTAIITENGNLYTFGNNYYGQLGLGNNTNTNIPTLVNVPGALKVKAVSCGGHHTVIITEDDNIYSFGHNFDGQLGLGDRDNKNRPEFVSVQGASKVIAASCGGRNTIVIAE